ncbi:outer membrane beta-barrel family protein [Sphingobacterium lumbrici]|uniref:outer membrane beta-barrel family protein n=1 Tax=Sphingobacterium lumbrici TaxID=2559600 RepID=UPI00112B6384|nr:outer membrane beta-barrel family protein [Sphingobacterium lumbrici]
MRNRLLFILLIVIPTISFAQKRQLKAVVINAETNEPIVGASVALLSQSSKAYIRGQQTRVGGKLNFDDIGSGIYALHITYVGLKDYMYENIVITNASASIDLGTLNMLAEGERLEEVIVQGRIPELRLDIDKKVFDATQSMVSTGGSASDLLANVPTLQVDMDGSVSLRGSGSVRILIDGKESAMAGSDVGKLLQSLPADAVSKVEIITNPSAKYDAEGQAGIINIVLKKNIRAGLNGAVNASVGNYENYSAGVILNYRDDKFNYFGSYNFRHGKNVGEGFVRNVQLIDGTQLGTSEVTNTEMESFRKSINNSFRLGADYYPTEKATLSLGANISVRDNSRGEDMQYRYINQPDWGTRSDRTSRQYEQDFGYDITFDFKQRLKREGEEITANVTSGNDEEEGTNSFFQTFDNGRTPRERKNIAGETGQNWNFRLDYLLPLGENHKFEAGYRTILRNSSESQYSDTLISDNVFGPDYNVSNDFEMKSGVHSLYANYQRMLTNRIGMQVGLRAEDAYLNTTIVSMNEDLSESDRIGRGKLDYFRLYPSAFLTYDVNGDGDKVQVSYTRRVQRPRGWQVNPFVNLSDEMNYRQGNPNLMPEDIHSFELSFAKVYEKWNFISSAYFRRINDMTQPFQFGEDDLVAKEYLATNRNATFSRWENVGSRNSSGVELIAKVNLLKWWDATGNVNMFYSKVTPYSAFSVSSVDALGLNGNLMTNVKFASATSMQIKGDYRAPMNTLQGKMKSMSSLDLALSQDVLKGKGTVMFNVRDVFDTRRFGSESYLPTRTIDQIMRWSKRTFNLSFSYRFGIQDLNRNKKNDYEMPGDDMGGEY